MLPEQLLLIILLGAGPGGGWVYTSGDKQTEPSCSQSCLCFATGSQPFLNPQAPWGSLNSMYDNNAEDEGFQPAKGDSAQI